MDNTIKILLLALVIILLLVYLNINSSESFTNTPTPTPSIANTNDIFIETLRNRYKSYAKLNIPISTTDFGRSCMKWSETNNPAYTMLTGNQCSALSP